MKANWVDGFDQRIFMDRLILASSNKASDEFHGEGAGLLALLRSMVKFSEELPWDIRRKILSSALRSAVKASVNTPKDLLQHIQAATNHYVSTPLSNFVLFTSINVLQSNKLPSWRSNGVRLTFLDVMPKSVLAGRADLFKRSGSLPIDREPMMKAVKLEAEARNFEEAATKCLDIIDLQRGIWNFIKTPEWRVTLGGVGSPLNEIYLGPLHTFHDKKGTIYTDQFWYEPDFWTKMRPVDLQKAGSTVLSRARKIKLRLSRHLYPQKVESAFIRYARALDLKDHDLALQKLWSLLEFLTDTGLASYDKTIRRAKFLYDEGSFQGQVLEHLRRYRNRSVHGGSSAGNVEAEVYQLKRIVEAALGFHLGNYFRFNSMTEACNFLDLSTDIDQLKRYQKNIRNAIAYRAS